MQSNGTLLSEPDEAAVISISGVKVTSPPPPLSQQSAPSQMREASNCVTEAKSFTSKELDTLLREHLETQATQW